MRDIDDTAFGPNRALGMRDILGYAPIEPDGSVKVKVPANVAFNISVLDARGRRLDGVLGSRHTNWLQVMPGEELECNGCHNRDQHSAARPWPRRPDRFRECRRADDGSPFPNTNAALFADAGETMAEVRNRVMCGGACEPSVDLAFQDYWPATPADDAFESTPAMRPAPSTVPSDAADPTPTCHLHERADDGTLPPVNASCTSNWTQPVPHHHPLRDAHPSDVGRRPLRRREQ